MGKRGPCSHCGINSTPLWRNGPLNKPVLCNACGSRYKSKGNLENYLPKTVLLPPQHKNFKNDSSTGSCLWNKISTKKRSQVKNKPRIKAMEYFHEQLLSLSKFEKESTPEEEESVLIDNMCNFIPSNEIGLGAMFLVPDAVPTTDSGSSHVPK